MKIVEAIALEKKYDMGDITVNALQGVDFSVNGGEFVAIMGPSGSGKSTLLHILGGLDTPNQGTVSLAQNNLAKLQDQALTLCRRKNIGFVFQFFNLLPTLTAEENILLPLMIDGKDLRPYREWLDTLLAMVGLIDRRYHRPDQLSGGEQQRVALARALITKPSILLADEPTGNLDSKTGTVIMELMRRSCDELGQTIVMVTHDSRASAYADRVVFLKDGKVHSEKSFDRSNEFTDRLRTVIQMIEVLEL
ncbi:MAG: ABC transporter ATP-binding protein [Anaerolineae bacterium]|nr:ABC transporter ATP-binding protein [Anaerolineae bacterium]